jgi:hypothetical protein
MKKKFRCKVEELPVIGGFLLSSLKKDIDDFSNFSLTFDPNFVSMLEEKVRVCNNLISSSTLTEELKLVTIQLSDKSKSLRVKLNKIEGLIKLAGNDLDVTVDDTGLKSVRNSISKGNTESLILNTKNFIAVIKRNVNALLAKGLRPELIDDIEKTIDEIGALNIKQNDIVSNRNRLTKQNIEVFNDLWETLKTVFNAAKAIYRGVDDTKLKDYTLTQLLKRIN